MDFIISLIITTIFWIIGGLISSFTLIPILIIIRFGIPFTKTLEKKEILNKNNGIVKRYLLINLPIFSIVFLTTFFLTLLFFPTGLIGLLIGFGFALLIGFGQTGENENNVRDYFQTNERYLIKENIDELYDQTLDKEKVENTLDNKHSSSMKLPRFFDLDETPVRVDYEPGSHDNVISTACYGTPIPPVKVLEEGREITEEEYNKLSVIATADYPRFFDVEGTLVKMQFDPKIVQVVGFTASGEPFEIAKAFLEGVEITREDYDKKQSQKMPIKALQGKTPLKELMQQITKAMVHNLNTHAGEDTLENDKHKGKQLISLISAEGESKEQFKKEAKSAYGKFKKTQS